MKVLLLNQCFYPDVVATAQQLTSLAIGLREKGHEVTVIASDRGYDDQSIRFPKRETWRGIEIIRIRSIGLGKSSKVKRALNFASFLITCSIRLLLLPKFDAVVGLTSPPLISFLGAAFARIRGGKFFFWVMDLNPDEAIAAGWLKKDSLTAGLLERFLRYSLKHSERVIVLDRFMKERIEAKGVAPAKIKIISPWILSDAMAYDDKGRADFRLRHGFTDSFVVMYAGNHSPCHPLDTLLDAALRLGERKDIQFCFVGGGSEKAKVKSFATDYGLENIQCLPYQPLEELAATLSAADLQVVVMGEKFVGIIHPCKVYNVMALGIPILYIGPAQSPIADVLAHGDESCNSYRARHGDVDQVTKDILAAAEVRRIPHEPQLTSSFAESNLLPAMIDVLEIGSVTPSPNIGEEITQF